MRAYPVIGLILTTLTIAAVGCGGDLNEIEGQMSEDDSRLIGDWELMNPDEPLVEPGGDDQERCGFSQHGLLYVNAEREAMIGLIQVESCDQAKNRRTYDARVLVEGDGRGGLRMVEAPAEVGNSWGCELMDDSHLLCQMLSPFDGQMTSYEWARVD